MTFSINMVGLLIALLMFALSLEAQAQTLSPTAGPNPSVSAEEETIIPTFETQKLARTYILDVPAPRGQITDRNSAPLAQNRLSYNLVITFPTPLDFSDEQALGFTKEKIDAAGRLLGRKLRVSDEAILRHYHNRGIMPLEIAQNLSEAEHDKVKGDLPPGILVRPVYVRIYPNGKVAGQIIGYTGKTGRNPDGIVDNHETLWPETEGREGLEQTFNDMLTGKHGEYKLTFDKDGRKTSDKLVTPPEPGYNVVTTLDLRVQQLAEKALEAKAKRGAIVIIDPTTAIFSRWPRGLLTTPTYSCRRSRRSNSRVCKMTRTSRFCHERIVRPTRQGPRSRSPSALPRWKVTQCIRTIDTNACLRFRLATSRSTTGKRAIAAR